VLCSGIEDVRCHLLDPYLNRDESGEAALSEQESDHSVEGR
jgi:hypothetical protein